MSLTTSEMTPADFAAVTGNNGGFGDNGGNGWWIILLFLILIGGWGNGWGNGNGANGGALEGYTQSNDFSNLERENDIIRSDICNQFANVNQTLANGFQTIQTSFANAELSRSNTQAALMGQLYTMSMADLQRGCDVQAAINTGFANTNYNLASQGCETRNTIQNGNRDIIDNIVASNRSVLDALTAQRIEQKDERIAELTRMNSALQLAQSQTMQNAYLLQTLRPYPVPAFTVVPPGTTTDTGTGTTTTG